MKNFCLEMLSNAECFQGTRNVEPALYPLLGCRGSLVLSSFPATYSLLETWATVRGWVGSGVCGHAGKAGAALCPEPQ